MFTAEGIRSSILYLIASYKCTGEAPFAAQQVRKCIPLALGLLTGVSYSYAKGYF